MTYYQRAYSLIEFLIVLVIISIILTITAPDISNILLRNRISGQLNQIIRAIHMARESAIFRNQVVTLCPTNNGNYCHGDWHEGMLLFIDTNEDRHLAETEERIYHFQPLNKGDKLHWRAFRRKAYLLMHPTGVTAYQNGTFTYCPKEGIRFARGVILNAAGRIRLTQDINGDGIDEGANGKPLRCI